MNTDVDREAAECGEMSGDSQEAIAIDTEKESDNNEQQQQQHVHWRNSNSQLSVPSERIQFQITLEEGESGNEDD